MQSGELQEEIIPKTFIEAFNLITIYIYKKNFHEYCLYDGNRRLNNNNNNNESVLRYIHRMALHPGKLS